MVLPLIPLLLIGTGVLTGGAGAVNGVLGAGKLSQAKEKADQAQRRYDAGIATTNLAVRRTNAGVEAYGARQADAVSQVVQRMVRFLESIDRQATYDPKGLLDGLDAETRERIRRFPGLVDDPVDVAAGAVKAGLTGAAALTGIPAAASMIGTASTGTALSGLSGAVGHGATRAWLGGGSLASGGGGIALGVTALNFVTVGPTLLVTGLTLNGRGEKALTRAEAFCSEVTVALAKQEALRVVLAAIGDRAAELTGLLDALQVRAVATLDALEAEPWDQAQHEQLLQAALRLTFAVRDLVTTPLLGSDGVLNDETLKIALKYKEFW